MRSIPLTERELTLIAELRLLRQCEQEAIQTAVHQLLLAREVLRADNKPSNVIPIAS